MRVMKRLLFGFGFLGAGEGGVVVWRAVSPPAGEIGGEQLMVEQHKRTSGPASR
jgi:hypothetical protein